MGSAFSMASITPVAAYSVSLECPSGCTAATTVYLGLGCDTTDFDGLHIDEESASTASAALTGPTAPTEYYVTLVTSQLLVGTSYRVCADLDGVGTDISFGD